MSRSGLAAKTSSALTIQPGSDRAPNHCESTTNRLNSCDCDASVGATFWKSSPNGAYAKVILFTVYP